MKNCCLPDCQVAHLWITNQGLIWYLSSYISHCHIWVISMSHMNESWQQSTKKHTHHINYFLHSCLLSCNLGIISFKSIWNKCISGFQFCDTSVFRFWGWISRENFSEFSRVKVNLKNSEGKFSRILGVNFNVH